jgi:hypothetical protein
MRHNFVGQVNAKFPALNHRQARLALPTPPMQFLGVAPSLTRRKKAPFFRKKVADEGAMWASAVLINCYLALALVP